MAKKKTFDSLIEIADHFDQIRSTNGSLTEQQVLDIVVKVTGQSSSIVKKRWNLITGIEWTVLDYLERGVIGMTRAMALVDNDLTKEERSEVMDKSIDDGIGDLGFKEYLQKYIDDKEEAAAEAEAEASR